MSSADRKGAFGALAGWLQTWPSRYGLALITICGAVAAQVALEQATGFAHSFLLFYPTIFIVAVLAGFGPGAVATLVAVVAAEYFYVSPRGRITLSDETEQMGLALFTVVGLALSWVADSLRRRTHRLQEFEKVVEDLEEMIVVIDRNYRYLIANRAFLRYRALRREQVIGHHAAEVLGSAKFETKVKGKLEECFSGKVVHFEMTHRYPELGERELQVSYLPIQGRGGIDRVACVLRDVTDQKKAEAELRQSEDRYRDLIEHSEDLVCTHDLTGRLLSVNPAPARLLGYGVDELLNLHMRDLVAPEFRASFDQYLDRMGSTGADSGMLCVLGKDGRRRIWEYRNSLRTEGVPNPIVRGMAHDVTERKQAEGALRRSEQRYRTLFEKTVAGVGIISLDGIVLDCNDAWARHFGHNSAVECRGVQIRDYCHDPSECERLLAELRRDGAFVNREWEMRVKDGTSRSVLLNSVLIEQLDGKPVIQSTMLDISERKRAGEALRRSEENYRNFVAQSSEGIFRQDLEAPIPIDLPEEELVHRIFYDSYMAEGNDAIVKMYGLNSVQDFLGRRLIEFLDPTNSGNVQLIREFVRSGFRIVNRESYETDVQGNAKVFRNSMIGIVEEGKLVRSWGIQRDVTDHVKLDNARRDAVDALRQSEERFRVALHDSPITVFNQDRELRYTWMYNPQLYWRQDMLGKTDDEIIGPKKAAALNALKQKVLSSGLTAREEVAIVQDGTTYVFDITVEPLFNVEKDVVGITAACMDIARLREIADRLQESRDRLASQKSYLESQIQTELGFEEIIGQSVALRDVLKKARIVAPTDSSVLLLGETGTGKELVARSIHALSSRNPNTFVKLNCAAVPSGLLESELFGHEKGAFTGAVNQKVGRIELADKGTLFLDEIGEMPPELQPKLLRVLQDREFERLGGIKTLHVDVRIVSATNRDLRQDVADKKFREDLFYRLNVFPIELPPLRERRDDIPMLVQHFLKKYSTRMGKRIEIIPEDSMRILRNWSWPGNVRELENMIERMVIMSKGSMLAPPPAEVCEVEFTPEDNLTDMEREHILRVLRETNGVLSGNDGAASRLGLKRTTLQSMIKRLGIQPHEYRDRGATGTFAR